MKKIRLLAIFMSVCLTLGGSTVCAADDFTAESEMKSEDKGGLQNVILEDGTEYRIRHDEDGNPYYSLFRTHGKTVDVYTVRSEINGVAVRALEYGHGAKEIIIPDTVRRIEENCFSEGGPEIISIPDSVTYIGEDAFWLSRLKKLKTGNGRRVLTLGLFADCRFLEEVEIGDQVEEIAGGAFIGCNKIKKIVIPPSVKEISGAAFNILPGVTVYGYKNSYAERWSKGMGYEFIVTGEAEEGGDTDNRPVLAAPKVKGNSLELRISNFSHNLWEGYEYLIEGRETYTDEDNDVTYTGTKVILSKDGVTTPKTTLKYLSPMYYYVQCRGYKTSEQGKDYGAWSMPVLTQVLSEKPIPPAYQGIKVKKNKNKTFDVTITVKMRGNWRYDSVLGRSQSSKILYEEKNMATESIRPVIEKKPGDYQYIIKNSKKSSVTFKGVKPGIYYFGSHSYNRINGLKNFSNWSQAKKIVIK